MCSIDLDPCDVWSETWRRARKDHACSCCGGAIASGERYVAHFSKFEEYIDTAKLCSPCHEAREEFANAHDAGSPQPGYFRELLTSCISDGDEESDAKWKPMLDAMDARRAARQQVSK